MSDDVFRGYGVKVLLNVTPGVTDPKEKFSDSFHVVRETLTRIGIASKKTKTLYQSCHILHKRGEYAILNFKELFKLDGKPADLSPDDVARRNTIVKLLADWNLLTILETSKTVEVLPLSQVRIISYADKKNWTLTPKYSIGVAH